MHVARKTQLVALIPSVMVLEPITVYDQMPCVALGQQLYHGAGVAKCHERLLNVVMTSCLFCCAAVLKGSNFWY